LATEKILREDRLSGKVYLFGTPAEEGGGGKIRLLNAGAYKGIDVSLMSHPGIAPDSALVRTAAYTALRVEYFGREAHAAARPWDGINALDALVTAYNALSVLRQQTQSGDIIQMQITNGGLRPNIIHAYSSGQFVVRSASHARLEALKARVIACFEAAALATGAKLKLTQGGSYKDHVPNHALGHVYRSFFNRLGGDIPEGRIDEIEGVTQASTDQGDISHALPSLHTGFWIRSEDEDGKQLGGPHTPDFEKAARTGENHAVAMDVGKALAATAVQVLADPELLKEVKRDFRDSPLI
jgi:amidohydrolase